MSRLGKNPIVIPSGVEISVSGDLISVKGPKGTLTRSLVPEVTVSVENNTVVLSPKGETDHTRALWGTYASHIQNMILGVTEGHVKKLELEGVGYRAEMKGQTVSLLVGFSHPVELPIPEGVEVSIEKNAITVSGIDKEAVGQFSATLRAVRPPEPYKGKGIHYEGEYIIRKQGKKAVT